MKAIMYHYVREFHKGYPLFRYLDIKNFRKQLDFFQDVFSFLSKEEWLRCVKTRDKEIIESNKIILTFDDAMSCHFDFVFPELVKRNLWGVFYVPVQPYLNKKLLDVHKVHLLTGMTTGEDLLELAEKKLSIKMIKEELRDEFKKTTYLDQQNYKGVSEFKRLFNYFIDYDYRTSLLDEIGSEVGMEFDVSTFYVTADQLTVMNKQGMVIGSHTVTHPVLSRLNYDEQKYEIEHSFALIENMVGKLEQKTFCFPYGGQNTYNLDTMKLLQKNDVKYSFAVENRDIVFDDIENRIHALPRYDCNFFPFGAAS